MDTEAPKTAAEKKKLITATLSSIEKTHGKGSVFNMGNRVGVPWPSLPTGIYSLDHEVLGIGGLPRGRIIEIYGPEAGGKTTLLLKTIAQAQKQGEHCALIDAENALDPNWAKRIGVNVDDLIISQPDNGEQALEIAEELITSQCFGIVGIDSVAALVPKAELEGDMGDAQMGLQARLMSQAMRKLSGIVRKTNTILVFINQIRDKLGVMFGSPETTTGGRALKFYSSVRLDVRKIGAVKEGDKVVGHTTRFKAVKNKMSPPFAEAEVNLIYEQAGFDSNLDLLDVADRAGLLEKAGTWISYKGERLGQGKQNAAASLSDEKIHKSIMKQLEEQRNERSKVQAGG
jgi:recombination protein RecA